MVHKETSLIETLPAFLVTARVTSRRIRVAFVVDTQGCPSSDAGTVGTLQVTIMEDAAQPSHEGCPLPIGPTAQTIDAA